LNASSPGSASAQKLDVSYENKQTIKQTNKQTNKYKKKKKRVFFVIDEQTTFCPNI